MPDNPIELLIASYLEPELVDRIRRVDPHVHVLYEPRLLRPPRYAADHTGEAVTRTADDESEWQSLLARATVMFDFDQTHRQDLPDLAPNVRWIQSTSAGIGQFVHGMGYHDRMPRTTFTTASGVHAQPLAEFCVLALLAFSRDLFTMLHQQRERRWARFAGTDLRDKTLLIVGFGKIGREVARYVRPMGMRVIAIKRTPGRPQADGDHVDELLGPDALHDALPRADFVVLITPHTVETERMIGQKELALLPGGAVIVNIGRGALIDEGALIQALATGHLRGAALDVFATEPLPSDSPLWAMPNVLVSPHSASTSDRENERIVALFCANLKRFMAGEPLVNVLDRALGY